MNTATGQERSPAQRRRRPLSLALPSAAGSTAVLLALYVATQGRPNLSDLISANRLLDLGGRDPPSSAQICRRIAFVRVGCEVKARSCRTSLTFVHTAPDGCLVSVSESLPA